MADPRSASLQTAPQVPTILAPFGYGPSSRRPVSPAPGFLYYDTTLALELVYIGQAWKVVGVQAVPTSGYGTTAQRPSTPQPGFLFFDTTLQQLIVWAATNWVIVGPIASSGGGGGTPGVVMVGYGPTSGRPSASPNGFLYFDTNLQQELVWKATTWLPIGPSESGAAPVVTSATTVSAPQNAPFNYQITGTNTPTSYGESGALPAGLSLNTGTGLISGTPTVVGSTTVTISATNGTGTGSAPLTITITVPSANPTITSPTTASGTAGAPFSYQITGTNSPTSFNVVGSLPSGVSVNTSTGLISGNPAVSGTFPVTVTATNGTGTGSAPLTITIAAGVVPSGRFLYVGGVGAVFPAFPAFVGATTDSAGASTLTVAIAVQTGGDFAPGVNYQLVSPSGAILVNQTTLGGESNINFSQAIAEAGGFSVVVTSSSAIFVVAIVVTIAGAARFRNGSYRGVILGPILAPPGGNSIQLFIRQVDPSTRLNTAELTEGANNNLRQAPFFSWDFNGDTAQNPKTDWTTGLTDISLGGAASSSSGGDSRIEVG